MQELIDLVQSRPGSQINTAINLLFGTSLPSNGPLLLGGRSLLNRLTVYLG